MPAQWRWQCPVCCWGGAKTAYAEDVSVVEPISTEAVDTTGTIGAEADNATGEVDATEVKWNYNLLLNGNPYFGEDIFLVKGDQVTLSMENVTVDGEVPKDLSYQWQKLGEDNLFEEISGATASSYSFEYEGGSGIYACVVQTALSGVSAEFRLKEDTLDLTASSNPGGKLDEIGIYHIEAVPQGTSVTLSVNATTTGESSKLTYQWSKRELWTGETGDNVEILDGATQSSYTLQKGIGIELYNCEVSDGNGYTEAVAFYVEPTDSLQTAPTINKITPERFERGYLYVAQLNEEVTMKINAVSDNANVKYRWVRRTWDGEGTKDQELGNTDTLVVKKGVGDSQDYADENYFCYVDDGNEQIEVMIILFGLHPYQVTAETKTTGDTPTITFNDGMESLSNSLLKKDLESLQMGRNAEIKLTVEQDTDVEESEKTKIEEKLAENSTVGMYLDLNLYKSVEGEAEEQITEIGSEISLSLDVPKDMQQTDVDQQRTYQIARVHDGEVELLDCEYDSTAQKLTFGTDRFSTYAIAYSDAKQEPGSGDSGITDNDNNNNNNNNNSGNTGESEQNSEGGKDEGNTGDSGKDTQAGENDTAINKAVKTGDNSMVSVWGMIVLISLCGAVGVLVYRKRMNR